MINETTKDNIIELLETVITQAGTCSLCKTNVSGKMLLDIDGIDGMQLEQPCLFEACNDAETLALLKSFFEDHLRFGFNLSCQLSRLLSRKGMLCKRKVETIIRESDWKSMDSNFFALSYVAQMEDNGTLLPRLLDDVPEDFRDGLFLALYLCDKTSVHDSLIQRFRLWGCHTTWTPTSTGEIQWLAIFIKKWLKMYPFTQLEFIIKLYFERL